MPWNEFAPALLKVALVTFSIAYMVRYTFGPFGVFLKLRKLVGIPYVDVYKDDDTIIDSIEQDIPHKHHLAMLLGCIWCLSVWIATCVVFWLYNGVSLTDGTALVFCSTAIVGVLHGIITE